MPETKPTVPPGVLLSWSLVVAPVRGRRPSIQATDLVTAAVALADAEGLVGVSMPRVARQVGVTQNALYRHVASKDELLVLIADAAIGDPPDLHAPDLDPSDLDRPDGDAGWRVAARAWAGAVLGRYLAHPWLLDIRLRAPATRNTVRWTEAFLQATRGTGLPVERRVQCAMLLDGHSRHVAALARDLTDLGAGYGGPLAGVLGPVLDREGCVEFADFLSRADGPAPGSGDLPVEEADFGRECILDGIEALVARGSG